MCICVFVYLRFCVFVYIHIWFQCRVPDEGVTRNALVDAPFVNFCICGYVFCVFVYLRLCVFVYLWFCVFVYMCIWFQCCVPDEDVTRSALGGFVPFPHFLLARSPEYWVLYFRSEHFYSEVKTLQGRQRNPVFLQIQMKKRIHCIRSLTKYIVWGHKPKPFLPFPVCAFLSIWDLCAKVWNKQTSWNLHILPPPTEQR